MGNTEFEFVWLEEEERTNTDRYQDLLQQTVRLLNSEWPRSDTARLHSLTSKQSLKTKNHLLLIKARSSQVIGHTRIVSEPHEFYVESFLIEKSFRGRGLGRHLMTNTENFIAINLAGGEDFSITLIARDTMAMNFYLRLGFEIMRDESLKNSSLIGRKVSTGVCNVVPPPPPMPHGIVIVAEDQSKDGVLMKKVVERKS